MRFFSRFILRWAGWIALFGTLLACAGGYYTVQLYRNLRTDFQELLPTTARSVIDLGEVSRRLESIDNLGILVLCRDSAAGKRFVTDLAHRLEGLPRNVITSVEYKIDRELKFFGERKALYIDLKDLIRIRDYIQGRVEYEKQLYNPLNIFSEIEIPEPRLDFFSLREKYESRTNAYSRFPEGYYATPDGTKRVVLAYVPGGGGIDAAHRLRAAVEKTVAELNPRSYAPDLEIKFTGGVEDMIEEHAALIADLELSTVIVILLVAAAMWAFFRSVRATFCLVFSLFMGTFWTFGASYFAVGYLNANSAFLGSIVIGNGINFGIIYLARYLEERRKGKGGAHAVRIALSTTATSTWTAALAAGLSYGSLILTGFRGFKQFGVIGLIGMVLCWISAFTLLPAYLTLFERAGTLIRRGRRMPKARVAEGFARAVNRAPLAIWSAAFLLTLVSIGMFARFSPSILETNLTKLRNKESMESGSAFLSKYLDEIFQRYLSPVVVLPRTREDAVRIADRLRAIQSQEGKHSLIANVQTIDDFVPKDQPEKIQVIKQIRQLLSPKIYHRLSEEDQKRAREFLNPMVLKPVGISDLPPLVLRKFTERDGSVGKMVLVEPPLSNDTWEGPKLIQFIRHLRGSADAVEPGAPVAGSIALTSDMIEAISRDGPRATAFALIAVVLLVAFLFREVRTVVLTLFALFLGVIWLAGVILGFRLKINFLNFIALPITFGIGVDYGVNIFQRYREERAANILNVVRQTGGAVGLCSFTTIVGYCSLLIAGNQAFVSFGLLAVVGELTCVTAAVIALPAYLLLRARRQLPGGDSYSGSGTP